MIPYIAKLSGKSNKKMWNIGVRCDRLLI